MRQLLVLVALVAINATGYLLWTRPLVDGRARLELGLAEREEELQVAKRQAHRWTQLERVVGEAQAVLEPWHAPAKGDFSNLRTAILDAERGLPLSRGLLEFRPESQVAAGFRGVRVKATEVGDFFSLWAFLERVSQWKAPLAPVELTLVADRSGVGLAKLTVTWVGLWPEDGRQ